jgi:nucleoside-diphosphate-sugar epimerase
MLHTGRHERPEVPAAVEHVHADPFDRDVVASALAGRAFDLAIVMYGRLRDLAEQLRDRADRLVSIGGGPVVDGFGNPWDLSPPGMPVPTLETAATADQLDRPVRNDKVARMIETEQAVFATHPSATHVRYPLIYGPHQLLPREWLVVRRILDGRRRIIVADGGLQLVSAAYVENAAAAVLVCVDQPQATAGQVLHASDETTPTVGQVIEIIAAELGAEIEIVDLPYALARPAYPLIMRGGSFHRFMPPTRLLALGYRDRVPYREGLARTVRWLVDNPLRGDAIERNLQDPFDYAAEDALLAAWDAAVGPVERAAADADPYYVDRYAPEREEDRERRRAARRARVAAAPSAVEPPTAE